MNWKWLQEKLQGLLEAILIALADDSAKERELQALKKELKDAKTDEQRRVVADKWADYIRRYK